MTSLQVHSMYYFRKDVPSNRLLLALCFLCFNCVTKPHLQKTGTVQKKANTFCRHLSCNSHVEMCDFACVPVCVYVMT